jgi:hypothetical protein
MEELLPGEGLLILVRKAEAMPVRYMVTIRKTESSFDAANDIQLNDAQIVAVELGKGFPDLEQAISAASKRLTDR